MRHDVQNPLLPDIIYFSHYQRRIIKMIFNKISIFAILLSSLIALDPDPSIEKKINDIIKQMTLEEKANMLGGDTTAFDSKPLPRLGIPALRMTDGPNGVRWGKSTAFPVGVCLASTWDTSLVYQMAQALGRETKAQGRNVLLGPCVNIHRDPRAGRNFESYGEDPYLAARTAVSYIKGLQSENIIATVKHFACNNQEFERNSIDARIDERTIREIYFPAFKAAIQEGESWSVMSAYNRLNGHYASSNTWLLKTVLKEEWGFKGFVMSDWGAVHSIVPTMYAGMDIEMPSGRYMNVENTVLAIQEGRMKESHIDEKIRRMLRSMFAMNLLENEIPEGGEVLTLEHLEIALRVAESGIVLLKNEKNLLPLNENKIESLAVIGPNAARLRTGGGGSSRVEAGDATSPLQALQELVPQLKIMYSPGVIVDSDMNAISSKYLKTLDGKPGLLGEYYDNADFHDSPVKTQIDTTIDFWWQGKSPVDIPVDNFSIRWTGRLTAPESGLYIIGTNSDDGTRLYLDDILTVDNWGDHAMETKTAQVEFMAGVPKTITIEFFEHKGDAGVILLWQKVKAQPIDEAVYGAKNSDAAILFMGFSDRDESEGRDRKSNAFPDDQVELIKKVSEVNKNVVVVFNSGAGVLMDDWVNDVPAIIESWYPGLMGGYAIADILFGQVNPSGKLVTTFFKKEQDIPSFNNYPGNDDQLFYEEGLFVGYRHYDKYGIEPLYPFGHGLSYTDFKYSNLKISDRKIHKDQSLLITFTVQNTGEWSGSEVVQLYLKDNQSSVERPLQELKGFSKFNLDPGEKKEVTLELPPESMEFWDPGTRSWTSEEGKFTINIGSSSRDIRLKGEFKLIDKK